MYEFVLSTWYPKTLWRTNLDTFTHWHLTFVLHAVSSKQNVYIYKYNSLSFCRANKTIGYQISRRTGWLILIGLNTKEKKNNLEKKTTVEICKFFLFLFNGFGCLSYVCFLVTDDDFLLPILVCLNSTVSIFLRFSVVHVTQFVYMCLLFCVVFCCTRKYPLISYI